ncbi:MAG: LPS export ABC transporter ATP-binding protein [Deltaproteobacteria bacterium]|nr:LPS export ABC transporter ATP-binding protein [Deltaproteobacteria bacterium]MBW1977208.1 LPS export ABC transporter ATP-binding protein [Deltaproteobacteria bacterium]MBW2045452.1 LPS export ABC transporter ATP-binding protein [Deltaproteobacteria bacterium]MBW2298927.1 LPS export ABC transporter ATP-binding protein [Deltaproteobacteria bacterium]RLB30437.1 MAG: LPS export ABC transporter ATP-binding protein [Deltaproteobacteria bacterium]
MAGNNETLEAKGLVKAYVGKRVVDHIDITLKRKEIVGLLGPNGAGKTTTFYMIVGQVRPDQGRVYLDGEEITHYPMYLRARKGITYLSQEPSVFRKLSVEENLLAILESLGLTRREIKERLEALLSELGISHLAKQKASSLSGGERRRLEITRALVIEPRFMLLDEPFAGIDPLALNDINQIIGQLKEKGIGIIISDHNVRETLKVCDFAYIINQGKIVEFGEPEKILQSSIARAVYLGKNFTL